MPAFLMFKTLTSSTDTKILYKPEIRIYIPQKPTKIIKREIIGINNAKKPKKRHLMKKKRKKEDRKDY